MHPVQQRLEEHAGTVLGIFLVLVSFGLLAFVRVRREWPEIRRNWPDSIFRIALRPWTWGDVGGVVLLLFACGLLGGWWLKSRGLLGPTFAGLVVGSLTTHAIVPFAVLLRLGFTGISLRCAFGGGSHRFLGDLGRGLTAYFALLPVLMLVVMVNAAVLKLLGHQAGLQNVLLGIGDADDFAQRLYLALWAVLLAPLAEEIFFRGMLFPVLLQHLRPATAIALVSCCFGAIHLHLPSFLPLTTLSVALCSAYVATGSLMVPVAMHMAFNAVTMSIVLALG